MKLLRFIRDNSLVAVAAVLLTACGTQAEESSEPTAPPVESTESTVDPSVEPTDQPEKPQQPGGGAPSIPVPTLPIGGSADDDSQVDQCVIANWLGDSEVPEKVSILVKTIDIKPPGVFDKTGSGCGGTTSCSGGFAFTSSRTKCSVAVRAKAEHGRSARLVFTGALRCPAGQDRICRDFVKKIKPQSIPLRQPGEPPSSEESPPSSNR
ncbi:MAG TPA: hypothetical protein VGX25_06105 [Actinophytocola sp.]|uniref:hypothetical protein n=1 Tax=Actinophytocola sp. TaxID=1872138 RepID=UPI002DDD6998|nr:hypothetical protein [Actinophytocola sp.]HEV2778959.1 hypothetical protein [Actinophytocola sp.]